MRNAVDFLLGRPGSGRSIRTRRLLWAQRTWAQLRSHPVFWAFLIAMVFLVLGSEVIYLVEQGTDDALILSPWEAVWYGIVTMTTTGYGDYTPKTPTGRLVGVALILGGMGLTTFITGTLASLFVAARIRAGQGLEAIRMSEHLLVCGWNHNAERVLEALQRQDSATKIVLVNELAEDQANELLARLGDGNIRYVRGDPASEATLKRANVEEATGAIVLADTSRDGGGGSDERTTLVTLGLKNAKAQLKVIAEALEPRSEPHLRWAGADEVIISGEFNGFLLSSTAVTPGISRVVRDLLSLDGQPLQSRPIPQELVGRTFAELLQQLRQEQSFLTVAILSEQRGLALEDLLGDDTSLVDRFIRQQFTAAGKEHLRFAGGAVRVSINPPDSYVIGPDDTAVGIPGAP